MRASCAPDEGLDTAAVPTRSAKRRGGGWLPGLADMPGLDPGTRSTRLGWFEGCRLLLAVMPAGAITGLGPGPGPGPGSAKEQPLAATFFAPRRQPHPRGRGVGAPAAGPCVTDTGFEGRDHHRRWRRDYGAAVLCPPKRTGARPWPRAWRRRLAGRRQIVATVIGALPHTFRLDHERPHSLDGLLARIAATMAPHYLCLWLNAQLGRPHLAGADLVDW